MMQDQLTFTGKLKVVLTGPDGKVKEEHEFKNLVVTAGKNWIAARMVGTPAVMTHMGIGTGTVAAAAGDVALGAQAGARVALGASSANNNVATFSATFLPGVGTGALTEAGIFNADTNGTMLCRTVFAVVNKGAADTMSITWDITAS